MPDVSKLVQLESALYDNNHPNRNLNVEDSELLFNGVDLVRDDYVQQGLLPLVGAKGENTPERVIGGSSS